MIPSHEEDNQYIALQTFGLAYTVCRMNQAHSSDILIPSNLVLYAQINFCFQIIAM